MQEVYVASYARTGEHWTRVGDAQARRPADVERAASGEWHGAGDGFAVYADLAARLGLRGCDPSIVPDAQWIAELAWPHLQAGEGMDAAAAQPLYVRHRVALTTAERAAGVRL
jgi:tRNA threonylcarbamoyladenosine biosynthesis protein TsaB